MNNQNLQNRFVPFARICLCVALPLLVSACGDSNQLPIGAELRIAPDSRTITVADRTDANGNCIINPDLFVDMPILISTLDGNGSPLGDVDVSVYVDFSGNTFSGPPVLSLFDDRRGNDNGVIDDFELVSGSGDDIAVVKTDVFGGDRPLLLRVNVSCPFKGDVFAFSDGVSGTSVIEIVADGSTDQTGQ